MLLIQLLTGMANAMFLFLLASGLSLIFGVTRVINFAHGAFYMLAAYLTYTLTGSLPLGAASFYLAALLASGAIALLGGVVEVCLLRRIYRSPELYQLLLTFALVLVIGDGVKLFWGTANRLGPSPPGLSGSVFLLGQLFPKYDLFVLALGPAVALGLRVAFYHTRWGVLVRAAAADREMAAALGVNQAWLFTGVFVLGSWLAGLAGALQAPRQALTTVMHANALVEAFVVVVIGGMGSVPGALLGSLVIGILQALGILFLPRGFDLAITFALMAVVLVVRPWGLLGRPEAETRPVGEAGGGPGEARIPSPRLLGGLCLLLLGLPFVLPTFYVWLLVEILAVGLFAASLQLLLGTGGMISFGHAAYFGLGAYGAALLLRQGGLPMPLALGLAPLAAGLAALIVGFFCVRLTGVYFAMLSLAFAQIAYAVVHQWYGFTGGDNGILGVWPAAGVAAPVRYYFLALFTAAGGISALWRIVGSPFGLLLRASRDHASRAASVGIQVPRQQMLAFTLAGLFAGLAGGLYAFLKGSVFPDYLSIPVSVEGLVMVLLGGLHVLAGAPLGAAAYKLLDTLITNATDYWQAVLGGILIAMVLALPEGMAGWRGRRGSRAGGGDG